MRNNLVLTDLEVAQMSGILSRGEHCDIRPMMQESGEGNIYEWLAEEGQGSTYLRAIGDKTRLRVTSMIITNPCIKVREQVVNLLSYIAQSNACALELLGTRVGDWPVAAEA